MAELLNPLEETKAQLVDLKKIRQAHRERQAQLQYRAAQFGYDVPAHISTEIDDVDTQLAEVNRKISLLEGSLPGQQQQLEPAPRSGATGRSKSGLTERSGRSTSVPPAGTASISSIAGCG